MNFKAVTFTVKEKDPNKTEILFAYLDEWGFEGINEEEETVTAFISDEKFSKEMLAEIKKRMHNLKIEILYSLKDIPQQNWNIIWESNFEPVVVGNLCAVRAPFHPKYPNVQYQITIEPKMSFGTGHHQTTRMMIEQMFRIDCNRKNVLDMGCGTGILGMLARMMDADKVTMIDNDKWAYENTQENIEKNNLEDIRVLHGGKEIVPDEKFDIVLANINKNILIDQADTYARCCAASGLLLISGMLAQDMEEMQNKLGETGFSLLDYKTADEWAMMMFERN